MEESTTPVDDNIASPELEEAAAPDEDEVAEPLLERAAPKFGVRRVRPRQVGNRRSEAQQ